MASAKRKGWIVSIAILVGICYVISFLWLRYWYLPTYELSRLPETHPLRPAFEVVYYPLRLVSANGWSPAPRQPEMHVGKLSKVEPRTLEFDYGDSYLSIGFVCEPSACAALANVRAGDQVLATFGTALVGGQDSYVNKLLSIRLCEERDPDCQAGREQRRVAELERKRQLSATLKRHQECNVAMEGTLSGDSRYVPARKQDEAPVAVDRFNDLVGEAKSCGNAILDAHRQAVFDSCQKHHCGDNIGGGCWHIADPIPRHVIASALEKCGT